MNSLVSGYRALVLGDTGALGQAFVSALKSDPYCAMVTGFSRSSMPSLLLEDPQSLQACAHSVANEDPFHLVIDATGALIIDDTGPEKRLDDLDAHHLQRAMQVNAIGPAFIDTPLLSKNLAPEVLGAIAQMHPVKRLGTSEEVSALTCFLLSDAASFITGSYHLADGGYTAV